MSLGERERPGPNFLHEAHLYRGESDFLGGSLDFIEAGVTADEPVLVAVDSAKIAALRAELDDGRGVVEFVPMERVGRNPGRIISVWHDFVERHPDRPVRGIGEPIWAGRDETTLVECQQHEHLLNAAFGATHGFRLRCPYDADALAPEVVLEAARSHPLLSDGEGDGPRPSPAYQDVDGDELLSAALPAPPSGAETLLVTAGRLGSVREQLMLIAGDAGFDAGRRQDIALVASELATNSLDHGPGGCYVRTWRTDGRFVVEVRDGGHIDDPLVGRRRPEMGARRGRGLWLVHELADLVQVRADHDGSTVRAFFDLPD